MRKPWLESRAHGLIMLVNSTARTWTQAYFCLVQRFTGPQIKKFHRQHPEVYEKTARISLVSSFLCSIFLGRIAPLDISDVCGMNLWDIKNDDWDQSLLALTTEGEKGGVAALTEKLGDVERTHGKKLGNISKWFVGRFDFSPECAICPFTGDNPATILALPLRPLDAIVSLGTSTTLLMATPVYHSSIEYHLFNHPTTPGLYMFMLCYCNGALAREGVRNQINKASGISSDTWDAFDAAAKSTPVAGKKSSFDPAKIGVYFPIPEIIPNVHDGIWRFNYKDGKVQQTEDGWEIPHDDVRAILEGQALSMRMRSEPLLAPHPKVNDNKAQPRRLYFVGGGSKNPAIMQIMAEVLGGFEGVYKLDIGSNACALGAAYYATWALERKEGEAFEDYVADRWDEDRQVKRIGDAYKQGVWEEYGEVLKGFRLAEEEIVKTAHN
jgi:xylulokinase